jgi:hypothetical protein
VRREPSSSPIPVPQDPADSPPRSFTDAGDYVSLTRGTARRTADDGELWPTLDMGDLRQPAMSAPVEGYAPTLDVTLMRINKALRAAMSEEMSRTYQPLTPDALAREDRRKRSQTG